MTFIVAVVAFGLVIVLWGLGFLSNHLAALGALWAFIFYEAWRSRKIRKASLRLFEVAWWDGYYWPKGTGTSRDRSKCKSEELANHLEES